MPPLMTKSRKWQVRAIGFAADALQIGLWPIMFEGAVGIADAVVDLIAMVVLTLLCGFRWYFLPSFVIELLPIIDLAPTWTIAAVLATRGDTAPEAPASEAVPPAGKITDIETKPPVASRE